MLTITLMGGIAKFFHEWKQNLTCQFQPIFAPKTALPPKERFIIIIIIIGSEIPSPEFGSLNVTANASALPPWGGWLPNLSRSPQRDFLHPRSLSSFSSRCIYVLKCKYSSHSVVVYSHLLISAFG